MYACQTYTRNSATLESAIKQCPLASLSETLASVNA
ncbi:hypothetical protein CFII68_21515, partial [Pseudomonas sp. CFII68]